MTSSCAYQGCYNTRYPCSKITFFQLPQDSRRQQWIENSGNPKLKSISNKTFKLFCEEHFSPQHIRRQFNRAILCKYAIPLPYKCKEVEQKSLLKNHNKITEERLTPEITDYLNIQIDSDEFETDMISVNGEYYKVVEDANDNQNDNCSTTQCGNEENESKVKIILNEKDEETLLEMESNYTKTYNNSNQQTDESTSDVLETLDPTEYIPTKKISKTTSQDYENDKHFVLSLVGNFQRLTPRKKAIAKLKILQFLTELEFSDKINLTIE